jgi:hypothetical protein
MAILTSSTACALGCLVRGCATNVDQLYVGTALLGLGAGNLWTVVLVLPTTLLSYFLTLLPRNSTSL